MAGLTARDVFFLGAAFFFLGLGVAPTALGSAPALPAAGSAPSPSAGFSISILDFLATSELSPIELPNLLTRPELQAILQTGCAQSKSSSTLSPCDTLFSAG